MRRYRVTKREPGHGVACRAPYVIFDEWEGAYCTLPDGMPSATHTPNLLPLEFTSREAAESWLRHCYATWAEWGHGRGAQWVPKHWNGFIPPIQSPWLLDTGVGGRHESEPWTISHMS